MPTMTAACTERNPAVITRTSHTRPKKKVKLGS